MRNLAGYIAMLRSRLDTRRAFLWMAALGVLLSLPTLSSGLFLDDYPQRISLLTRPGSNVFDFIHPGSTVTAAWLQSGVLPWWTHPQTKIEFFRPIAQWFMEQDYRFWPDNIPLMHLHSVLWYGVLVGLAGWMYRQFLTATWVAGLAALVFAIDAPHRGAVAWLANRNAMIGMIAALGCLYCYQRRGLPWCGLGALLLALALGCSEGTLAITGYLFAYEVCLSDQRWYRRILRLLPYAAVTLGWLSFWKQNGYGTAGPGFYVDPISDPAAFLAAMVYRFPAYLVGQMLIMLPPTEIFSRFEDSGLRPCFLAYAWAMLALLTWMLLPLLRRSREARFFVLGMLIAAIPICGSMLYSRALWYVGFGAAGLIALAVERFSVAAPSGTAASGEPVFVASLLVLHLLISPLLFVAYGARAERLLSRLDSQYVQLPDQAGQGRSILAISVLNYGAAISFPLLKDEALSLGSKPTRRAPSIQRIRALVEGAGEFDLLRKDENTLEVSSQDGFSTLRPLRYAFAVGDRVTLDDVEINIEALTSGKMPSRIEYRFNPGVLAGYEPLAWDGKHFVPFTLPVVGASVHIATRLGR